MNSKSWEIANILIWGSVVGLLVVGLIVIFPALAPYLSTLFSTPNAPVVTVIVTPTPESTPTPAQGKMESAAPDAKITPQPFPLTATAESLFPLDIDGDAIFTYTLPVATGAAPSRIAIPAIGMDAPIVPIGQKPIEASDEELAIWDVPNWRAAGWHETSVGIGVPGNTVLNGHNTSNGEVFRNLYKLDVGAHIDIMTEDGPTHGYTVTEKLIVREAGQSIEVRRKNAQYILPTADERLTLVTCHPYGSLANRLLIIARPVSTTVSIEGE